MSRERADTGWKLVLALNILFTCIVFLSTVWCNIDRTNVTYAINSLQEQVREHREHHSKLEVERAHLLSPYVLESKAHAFGMHQPRPGQIRRMDGK